MEKRTNKMSIDNQKTSFEHQSLEVSMLDKDNFSDEELDSYLSKGEIKATDKVTIPPKILFVGDCTIATFGNFYLNSLNQPLRELCCNSVEL